jgi:hypothetical protein
VRPQRFPFEGEVNVTTEASRRRIPAGILWGAFGVLAWAAFSIFIGGGSAQADEAPEDPPNPVTSLVSSVVSGTTSVVAPVVTEVVAPVVQAVVAPVQTTVPAAVSTVTDAVSAVPVVGPVTSPVVTAVTDTATAVTAPVTEALQEAPVSQVADPILDAVTGLPVAGQLLQELGLLDALHDVVGAVDATTGLIGDVADGTLPPVLGAVDPSTPGAVPDTAPDVSAPALPSSSATRAAAPAISAPSSARSIAPWRPGAEEISVLAALQSAPASALHSATTPADAPPRPSAPTSSAVSGGGSASDGARIFDADADPLHAWKRTLGASDDVLPTSTVADTDVSPD